MSHPQAGEDPGPRRRCRNPYGRAGGLVFPMETVPTPRRRSLSARWRGLSPQNRRRIVLGSLLAASLAARDLMLLLGASSLFALSELGGAPRPRGTAA